ncbi:MAG: hypothetical protein BGO49_27615 [Planctomycetales bacterium 71-10]|nr:MAG: hypothetical protein BGO49_27615 [Planctomycetales bacterium 71-10]
MTDDFDPQAWITEEAREAVGTPAEEALRAGVCTVAADRVAADEHETLVTIFAGCLDSSLTTISPDSFLNAALQRLEAGAEEKERLTDLIRSVWRTWDESRPYSIVSEKVCFDFRQETLDRLAAFYRQFRQTPYYVSDDRQRQQQANEEAFANVLDGVFTGYDPGEMETCYAYEAARKIACYLGDERPVISLLKKSASSVNWTKEGF